MDLLITEEEYQKFEQKSQFSGAYVDSRGEKHYFMFGVELEKSKFRKMALQMKRSSDKMFNLVNTEEDQQLGALELFDEIQKMYDSPGRFYHNTTHFHNVLSNYDQIKSFLKYPTSVDIALTFHDVIYDPKQLPGVNERNSVAYMYDKLEGIVDNVMLNRAEKIIMATAYSCGKEQLEVDSDTAYALDCDLAVLGENSKAYMEYERNIRKEYSFCDFEQYRAGRIEFLQNLLSRPKIFYTELFQKNFEQDARENMRAAVQLLTDRQTSLF